MDFHWLEVVAVGVVAVEIVVVVVAVVRTVGDYIVAAVVEVD